MTRLRLKESVKDADLAKYGFTKSRRAKHPDLVRSIDGEPVYRVYFTDKHRNLQVITCDNCVIATSLQLLLYRLTRDGLLEEWEDTANA
jgi:hypothetical protein